MASNTPVRFHPFRHLIAIAQATSNHAAKSILLNQYSSHVSNHAAAQNHVRSCTSCGLARTCTKPVPFDGVPGSVIALGEAPGSMEDEHGIPFHPLAPAGSLLKQELERAGLDVSAYVNTVCCYPPERPAENPHPSDKHLTNRTPHEYEIAMCRKNLDAQVDYLRPWLIVGFGRLALEALSPGRTQVEAWRGKIFPVQRYKCWGLVTWHPSYLRRNQGHNHGKYTQALMQMREDLLLASWGAFFHQQLGAQFIAEVKEIRGGYNGGLVREWLPLEPPPKRPDKIRDFVEEAREQMRAREAERLRGIMGNMGLEDLSEVGMHDVPF